MKPTREALENIKDICDELLFGDSLKRAASQEQKMMVFAGALAEIGHTADAALLQEAKTDSDHVAVTSAEPEASLTDECQTAFEEAKEGDTFRDTVEELVASDYFAEGWKSGISSPSHRPNEKDVVGEGK